MCSLSRQLAVSTGGWWGIVRTLVPVELRGQGQFESILHQCVKHRHGIQRGGIPKEKYLTLIQEFEPLKIPLLGVGAKCWFVPTRWN